MEKGYIRRKFEMNEIEELEELEDEIRIQKLRVSLRKIWEELRKEGFAWWEIGLFINQEWREFQKRRKFEI